MAKIIILLLSLAALSTANDFNFEIARRAADRLASFLSEPSFPATETAVGFRVGLLSASNPDLLRQFTFTQITVMSQAIEEIIVGFESGLVIGYYNNITGDGYEYATVANSSIACDDIVPCYQHFAVDAKGVPFGESKRNVTFNVTSEPWYVAVKASGQPAWTPIFAEDGVLVIAYSRPLFSNSVFVGAITIEFRLVFVDEFLKDGFGDLTKDVVFIVDNNENLVACSVDAPVAVGDTQIAADHSTDRISEAMDLIGEFSTFTDVLLGRGSILVEQTVYHDQSADLTLKIIVTSETSLTLDHVDRTSTTVIIVLVLAAGATVTNLLVAFWVWYYRRMNMWKLAQPLVSVLVCLSLAMTSAAPFVLLGENTDITCNLRVIWIAISITFVCATLLAKIERVYDIATTKSFQRKTRGNLSVVFKVLAIVGVQVLILIIWLTSDPYNPKISLVDVGANQKNEQALCHSNERWGFAVAASYIAVLMIAGGVLSYLTKDYSELFAESRTLMLSVYHGVIIISLVLALGFVQSNITTILVIISLGATWFTMATLLWLFAPRILRQVTVGDLSMEEVFEKTKKQVEDTGNVML